ncbi:hypothetical protein VTN00DRAFT_8255 [Thermoascus crustaceus]|uniref:uncharacterized protein n=1 Tax=Thermoascus crustaceus TaxID=5088 RepID=UPI0037428D54
MRKATYSDSRALDAFLKALDELAEGEGSAKDRPNPGLTAKGWQVITVDYGRSDDLRYKLTGVDTVISTISGQAQIALIDAAAQVHVRRFVPSEFEGRPSMRPPSDILDRGKKAALNRLQYYEDYGMEYTVFVCGVFYERFAPGGMAAFQIGHGTYVAGEGDYLMDIRKMTAQIPYYNSMGQEVHICMTSVQDVARFVVAALDLPAWPTEFRMRGDRMALDDVVRTAEIMRGVSQFNRIAHTEEFLLNSLSFAKAVGNMPEQWRLYQLLATMAGRYDFDSPNLNGMVNVQPSRFRDWLYAAWSQSP